MTQRSLAARLGVALGLTNLLIRRLVAKGYVRMAGAGPRHVRYFMTATGREALARATRLSMDNTVRLYTETRDVIRSGLYEVSARCPVDAQGRKPVVFYGIGDVAEIAYISLQGTGLTLAGAVDDKRKGAFFGLPIQHSARLSASSPDWLGPVRLVVTTLRHATAIEARLVSLQVPLHRVSFLHSALNVRSGPGESDHASRP